MAGSDATGATVDASVTTRAGEELDLEALKTCLGSAWGSDAVAALAVQQFPSGHSNLTYLVRVGDSAGRERELVLRRPPFGNKVKTAHDMGREHRLLSDCITSKNPEARPLQRRRVGARRRSVDGRISGVFCGGK
jgi:aminoglycoside phosphotransferase (APT) family kinase protein